MFMDFLRDHRGGLTHTQLTEALQELVGAVVNEQRAGKLTLTLTIKPFGKKDGLEVSADVKLTPPKEQPGTSVFYADAENNLRRIDHRQQAMDLHQIPPAEEAVQIPINAHRGIA